MNQKFGILYKVAGQVHGRPCLYVMDSFLKILFINPII